MDTSAVDDPGEDEACEATGEVSILVDDEPTPRAMSGSTTKEEPALENIYFSSMESKAPFTESTGGCTTCSS